jgi:hypothetical protein
MKGKGLTPACVQSQKGKEVFILYFFYLFDCAVKNLAAGAAAWMPLFPEVIAAKRQLLAIRQRRIDGVCRRQTPMSKSGRTPDFGTRKGLEGCEAAPP